MPVTQPENNQPKINAQDLTPVKKLPAWKFWRVKSKRSLQAEVEELKRRLNNLSQAHYEGRF